VARRAVEVHGDFHQRDVAGGTGDDLILPVQATGGRSGDLENVVTIPSMETAPKTPATTGIRDGSRLSRQTWTKSQDSNTNGRK
jgi:hypothetical protein